MSRNGSRNGYFLKKKIIFYLFLLFFKGGPHSANWTKFKQLCCEAYNILRKSANLILNLFSLMVDSAIPDVKGHDSILKVQEKFRLELTDEEAIITFQSLINESITALFPVMVEKIHTWTTYWRS